MGLVDIRTTPSKGKLGAKRKRIYRVDSHAMVPTHELHIQLPKRIQEQVDLTILADQLRDRCVPIVATEEETLSLHDLIGIKAKNIVAFVKGAALVGNSLCILIQPTGLYESLITNKAVSIKWSLGDRKRRDGRKPVRYLIMERVLLN